MQEFLKSILNCAEFWIRRFISETKQQCIMETSHSVTSTKAKTLLFEGELMLGVFRAMKGVV